MLWNCHINRRVLACLPTYANLNLTKPKPGSGHFLHHSIRKWIQSYFTAKRQQLNPGRWTITLDWSIVKLSPVIHDLGILYDIEPSMHQNMQSILQMCFVHLRSLCSDHCLLGYDVTAKFLVTAIVLYRRKKIRKCLQIIFQSISKPTSRFYHLLPPLCDTSAISRLRSTIQYNTIQYKFVQSAPIMSL